MWRAFLTSVTLLAIATSGKAQTTTVINGAGQTVVEVITTNPNGVPQTSIIQTLSSIPVTTSATATTPFTITPTPVPQGPVGQPAPTLPGGGVTPFTYTTVIGGVTIVTTDVFTPSFAQTAQPTFGPSGTRWNYSSWTSVYGPPTTAGKSGAESWRIGSDGRGWRCGMLTLITGVVGGAWLVL